MTVAAEGRASGPLVVLDADSTLIREEAIELLADAAGSLALVTESGVTVVGKGSHVRAS